MSVKCQQRHRSDNNAYRHLPDIPVLGIALRYWDDPLRLITAIMLPVFCGLADHLLVDPASISQPLDRCASEKWSRFLVAPFMPRLSNQRFNLGQRPGGHRGIASCI